MPETASVPHSPRLSTDAVASDAVAPEADAAASSSALPPVPADVAELCAQKAAVLPVRCTTAQQRDIQSAGYALRLALIGELCARYAGDSARNEERLRRSLPQLSLEPLPLTGRVAAWRLGVAALLGLVPGVALGQAVWLLAHLPTEYAYCNGLVMLCGAAGAWLFTWGLLHLTRTRALCAPSSEPLPLWRRALRVFRHWWGWVGLGGVVLLRDLSVGALPLETFARVLAGVVQQGYMVWLFSNVYTVLLWIILCVLVARAPLSIARADIVSHMRLAAENWWAGASVAAECLLGDAAVRQEAQTRLWHSTGQDLLSFAQELPRHKQEWLHKRLADLGFTVARDTDALLWSADMADIYSPVGHLAPGDTCFVDIPPLYENGVLVRKGTMRKVR